MSKEEGKKIAIKFTEPLNTITVNLITTIDSTYSTPVGSVTASSYFSGYTPGRAFDTSLNNAWMSISAPPQWIQIMLPEAKAIAGFQLYNGDLDRVNAVNLFGSNDGVNYDLIKETINTNIKGWNTHAVAPTIPYKYYKWQVLSKYSNYIQICELQLLFVASEYKSGHENAFTITGSEYHRLDGPNNNGVLIPKSYGVSLVQSHPTEPNSILIDVENFNNSQGAISISYNQAVGNLAGQGGAVASFIETFTPSDLVEGLTDTGVVVGTHEYINVNVGGSVQLKHITKLQAYNPEEYIEAAVGGTIQFKHISEINP